LCAWLLVTWTVVQGTSQDRVPGAGPVNTVWDGVYTVEQAARGQEHYDVFCANCHGVDMEGQGVDVPPLADEAFTKKWRGRTLKALFDLVSQAMPENRPGTLKPEVYSAVIAYILQENGFPAGVAELRHDSDVLARTTIESAPPGIVR
jgi:mono/diheme cytochrome c family protein